MVQFGGVRDPLFKNRFVEFATGPMSIYKGMHVRIVGPNGIGKSTLLEDLTSRTLAGSTINPNAIIGYYRQDFSSLNFDDTVLKSMMKASAGKHNEQDMRKIGSNFFFDNNLVRQRISSLSEGQKGLLALTCLVLQQPSILIVDEPTNHINFRY